MSRYRNERIRELAEQQVRFAPQAVKTRQISQAEDFLFSVKGGLEYRFGEVCFAVTGTGQKPTSS